MEKIAEIKCPLCHKTGMCKYEEPATPQDCFKNKWHDCEKLSIKRGRRINNMKQTKVVDKKKYPRLTIERYGFDKDGHVLFVDLHDEKTGEAIFFKNGTRHFHGFYNDGDCQ